MCLVSSVSVYNRSLTLTQVLGLFNCHSTQMVVKVVVSLCYTRT